jgi:hypothetical protein
MQVCPMGVGQVCRGSCKELGANNTDGGKVTFVKLLFASVFPQGGEISSALLVFNSFWFSYIL